MGERGGFRTPWGQRNWCSEQNTVFTEQWDGSPFWPGKGNQCKRGIDSSWIFIHDQIDSTMLTSTCRLCSAGAWVTLAHPKGGWANADAFIFNINLEQTQEQLQFCSMTPIRGKENLPEHLEAVLYVCFAITFPALTLLDIYSTASLPLPSLPLENELIAQYCSFFLKNFAPWNSRVFMLPLWESW